MHSIHPPPPGRQVAAPHLHPDRSAVSQQDLPYPAWRSDCPRPDVRRHDGTQNLKGVIPCTDSTGPSLPTEPSTGRNTNYLPHSAASPVQKPRKPSAPGQMTFRYSPLGSMCMTAPSSPSSRSEPIDCSETASAVFFYAILACIYASPRFVMSA